MSEGNRVQLGYISETTFGTTPTTGTLQVVRRTGGNFAQETDTTESAEVRSDRALSEFIRTNIRATGDIQFEMSLGGSYDTLMEGVAANDYSTALSISSATDISATASSSTFTSTTSGAFTNVGVGQWLRFTGFTNSGNNGFFQVTSKPDNENVVVSGTLTDEAAGASVNVSGTYLRAPGTTAKSMTIEQGHLDINQYLVVTGARPSTFELNVGVGEIITGSFGFLGQSVATSTSSLATGGVSLGAATTTSILNAVDNVALIREGGVDSTLCVQSLSLTLDNTLRENMCIGTLGLNDIPYGTCRVTGNMTAYFEDVTAYTKYLNFTASSLSFLMFDGTSTTNGNAMMITVPNLKFSSGGPDASAGLDSDVTESLDFTAILDSTTTSSMLQVDRWTP